MSRVLVGCDSMLWGVYGMVGWRHRDRDPDRPHYGEPVAGKDDDVRSALQ
jgi:hypothetical protein